MPQTSITKWLRKPKAVTQPDAVQLEPRRSKKTDNNTTTAEQTAKPLSSTTAESGDNVTPTPPIPSQAPATVSAHDGSTTALGSASANRSLSPPSTTTITTLPPLSPNITLAPITGATIPSFRRLNTLLLEIPYPTKFYDEILTDRTVASITLAAFWRNTTTTPFSSNKPNPSPGILVAGIRCRLLSASSLPPLPPTPTTNPDPNAPPKPLLYIATLSTLSPYRSHGLATHLLAAVTRAAARQHGAGAVCAHVWVANADGLAWYRRRGFEVLRREEGYYRRLTPAAAWVVWRRVGVGDLLGGGGDDDDEGGAADGAREGEDEEEEEDGEEGERMEGVEEGDGGRGGHDRGLVVGGE